MPLEKKEQLEKEQEKQRKQRTKEEWKTVVSKPVEQAVTHTHMHIRTYTFICHYLAVDPALYTRLVMGRLSPSGKSRFPPHGIPPLSDGGLGGGD